MDPFDGIRAFGALILVLGIILGLAWALRRYGGRFGMAAGQRTGDLQVVEFRALDTRRKLAVVKWGDKEHLICIGPAGDSVIAERQARDRSDVTSQSGAQT